MRTAEACGTLPYVVSDVSVGKTVPLPYVVSDVSVGKTVPLPSRCSIPGFNLSINASAAGTNSTDPAVRGPTLQFGTPPL